MNMIQNPFAGYGGVVSGGAFIGRESLIRAIEGRVIAPADPGSLAIVGLPRIGKSSLVQEALMSRADELFESKNIPLWVNVATFRDAPSFFRYLVMIAYQQFENRGIANLDIEKTYLAACNEHISWAMLKFETERFFEKVNRMGYRIIFILDEFDGIRSFFSEDISAFQQLRELGYRGPFKVSFVTTSRRSIRDIEIQSRAISVLDLIFKKEYLSLFNNADIEAYMLKFSEAGVTLTNNDKSRIEYYCGRHPYLLAVLGFEIIELCRLGSPVNIMEAYAKVRLQFASFYEQLITLLQEDATYNKLIQTLFGPQTDVTPADIDELLIYGLIKKTNGHYHTFSEHFQAYLAGKEETTA